MEFPAGTEIVDGDAFAPGAPFDRDADVVDAEKMFKLPGSLLLQPDLARPSAIEEHLSAPRPQRMQGFRHLVSAHRDDIPMFAQYAQPAIERRPVISRKQQPCDLSGREPAKAPQFRKKSAVAFSQLHGRTVSVAPQCRQRTSTGQEL